MSNDDRVFHWTKEPDPRWLFELARIAAPKDQTSHLTIRWVPMHNRRWAQRWVVFECVPAFALRGHHWQAMHDAYEEEPMIWWAWEYLRQTGTVPTPMWVCQGNAMGHPYTYNLLERRMSNQGLLPESPPPIGALAYAEPTELTWEGIRRRDLFRNSRLADPQAFRDMERAAGERAKRAMTMKILDETVGAEVAENVRDLYENHTRRVDDRTPQATDEHIARYIETGDTTLRPIS